MIRPNCEVARGYGLEEEAGVTGQELHQRSITTPVSQYTFTYAVYTKANRSDPCRNGYIYGVNSRSLMRQTHPTCSPYMLAAQQTEESQLEAERKVCPGTLRLGLRWGLRGR